MTELLNTIRAHIDQQYEGNREKARYDDYYRGMNDGLDKLEQFLDTLQEPEFPATDEEIETFLASHPKVEVPEKYKTPDWLYKELEQEPEVDGLEEEIKRYRKEEMPVVLESDLNDIARHFYELGQQSRPKISDNSLEGLEEEYKDYVENDPVYSKLVNRNAGLGIARHFAEWGAIHLKK